MLTRDLLGESAKTYNEAVVVFPVPPFVEEILLVVLIYVPVEEAVTLAVIVQVPPATIDPPARVIIFPPEAPVTVPPH